MKDDFLTRFRKPPPPEFAASLYERISEPMEPTQTLFTKRRLALAGAVLLAALTLTLIFSPGAQALARDLIRQIGAITLIDMESQRDEPVISQPPTAEPPDDRQVLVAESAAEIAQLAGFQPLTPNELPDRYIIEGGWLVTVMDDMTSVYKIYKAAGIDTFLVYNAVQYAEGAQFEQAYGSNETVQDVNVRGQAGVWITGRLFGEGPDSLKPTNWLMWEEEGTTYTFYSDDLDLEEALRVAESMSK
jgi:hypothetical protein